jgi:hypothetical protein
MPPKKTKRGPGRPKGSKNKKRATRVESPKIPRAETIKAQEAMLCGTCNKNFSKEGHPAAQGAVLVAMAIKDLKEWLDHKIDQVLLANGYRAP